MWPTLIAIGVVLMVISTLYPSRHEVDRLRWGMITSPKRALLLHRLSHFLRGCVVALGVFWLWGRFGMEPPRKVTGDWFVPVFTLLLGASQTLAILAFHSVRPWERAVK